MKNLKQLQELVALARSQKTKDTLVGHDADAEVSTNSWGPQMRV